MLCVKDVGEQVVDGEFELGLCLGQRLIELVVSEHQIHNSIVRDNWLLKLRHEIYYSGETEGVIGGLRLTLDHFLPKDINQLCLLLG